MNLFKKRTVGERGEDAAAKFLRKKHYKILKRNFKNAIGEIDIIARDKEYIVFVEVKTRSSKHYGGAVAAVNYTKQQKIIKVAQSYLKNISDFYIRFDIVEVYVEPKNKNVLEIHHIENAFGA